jgi:hypothetical protein
MMSRETMMLLNIIFATVTITQNNIYIPDNGLVAAGQGFGGVLLILCLLLLTRALLFLVEMFK